MKRKHGSDHPFHTHPPLLFTFRLSVSQLLHEQRNDGAHGNLALGFAFTGVIELRGTGGDGVPEPVVALCVCSTLFGMLFQVLAIVIRSDLYSRSSLALRGSKVQ